MRSNYAALKEFKETAEKNELHAKREEILANENFDSISEKMKKENSLIRILRNCIQIWITTLSKI